MVRAFFTDGQPDFPTVTTLLLSLYTYKDITKDNVSVQEYLAYTVLKACKKSTTEGSHE